MKNDNEKTKYNEGKALTYFKSFSGDNIKKIKVTADIIYSELEINKKITPQEIKDRYHELDEDTGEVYKYFTNSNYVLDVGQALQNKGLEWSETSKLLEKIGDAFKFFDQSTPLPNPHYPPDYFRIGITSKENFDFFYKQLSKFVSQKNQGAREFIKIKDVRLDVENYLLEINNGEKLIYFKSRKNSKELDKETKRFKVLALLWEFRWELKDNKVIKKGDFFTLDNIRRNTKIVSDDAVRKQIERLNNIFKEEKVPVEIEGQERCRLVIHK